VFVAAPAPAAAPLPTAAPAGVMTTLAAEPTRPVDRLLPFIGRGAHSFIDARSRLMVPTSLPDGVDGGSILSLDLSGQFVDPTSGFGFYGALGASYDNEANSSASALNGIDVGGLYVADVSPDSQVTFQAGLILPSAPGIMDKDGLLPVATAVFSSPDDLARGFHETWARLGATPIMRSDDLFLAAHLGVDFAIDGDIKDNSEILNGAVAAGLLLDQTTVSIGLAGYAIASSHDTDDKLDTGINGKVEIAHNLGTTQLVAGLGGRLNDNPNNVVAFDVGLRAGF
jgi:hypothetical protein